MNIRITGVKMLIQQMDHTDLRCLCEKYLHIDYRQLSKSIENGRLLLEQLSDMAKPSVSIDTSPDIDTRDCNVTLELKRSFFDSVAAADAVHGFEFGKLLRFLSRFKYSIKQIDIAYTDDEKCLSARELQHWCTFSQDNCIGSLVKWKAPELVVRGGTLRRIKLETADSKTNFGTINIAPRTGRINLVLKVRKKEKIQYVLKGYGYYIDQLQKFEARCRALLVSCIDVVTARSKKNRVKARYERQPSWKAFIGQEIEAVNWSSICCGQQAIA